MIALKVNIQIAFTRPVVYNGNGIVADPHLVLRYNSELMLLLSGEIDGRATKERHIGTILRHHVYGSTLCYTESSGNALYVCITADCEDNFVLS